jgi:hypothetical protein
MSKFGCRCGHTIGFNVWPCRYEGDIIRDSISDEVYAETSNEIASYVAAIRGNRRDEWLQRFYGQLFDIKDDDVIADILSRHLVEATLSIHQCEKCGRLWLQTHPSEELYAPYVPEGEWRGALEWRGTLKARSEGFISYLEGQHFFGSTISKVQYAQGVAKVVLVREDKSLDEVIFSGVTDVNKYDLWDKKQIRFLSKWKGTPLLHRFLFDSTSQSYDPILEITAEDVTFESKPTNQEP